ncbi:1-aminomutase,Glutamate-1-semialdehyde 2 [Trichinella spiralis]|uniref:1-aminomutase,Glutamate-1-semialdehyde 2 n=1 Tax=Trichinella spiralis TaxID=6334 RepID=A0ABR3KNJ9_TRISP
MLDQPRWTGWMSCVGEPMASGIDSPLHSVVRPYPILDAKNKSAQLTVMHGDVAFIIYKFNALNNSCVLTARCEPKRHTLVNSWLLMFFP